MMTSLNVQFLFFLVFIALASNRNDFRALAASTFKIGTWDTNLQSNFSDRDTINENELDTERIVGGQYAEPGEFPFMAVVHRLLGNGVVSQCGGTIITSRWVLTAGHCAAPEPHRFLVVFGIYDKTGIGYSFYQGPGVAMSTNQAVVHPAYQVTENDIALLYMPHHIPFGQNIQPIQLAGVSDTFANRMSKVIGWGKDGSYGTGTNKLKYALLPIISNSQCSMYWSITEKHICTSPGSGKDACQGDSGGPLIVTENGTPVQVGIVSYGDGNCPSGKPGVFTRVSKFIDWIESVTNQRI